MADKHTSLRLQRVNSSILADVIVSSASERLDALCEQSRREKIAKVLSRRRRKWKKRHKLLSTSLAPHESRTLDLALSDEKRRLEEIAGPLVVSLVKKIDEGLQNAMDLQTEESNHSLGVFRHRLAKEKKELDSYTSSHSLQGGSERQPSPFNLDDMGIIKELKATISQAEAVAEIRKMKHAMTPRVPQLHNRTLSGNIFDQSLGILHDSILDGNGITTELLDSEHAHLQIIGKEVSISQEESDAISTELLSREEQVYTEFEGSGVGSSSGAVGSRGEPRSGDEEMEVIGCNLEKFSCSDDTPGIGMEVVCAEGSDSSVSVTTHPMSEMEATTLVVSSQNGMMNGLDDFAALGDIQQQSPGMAGSLSIENRGPDSEGEVQLKILRLFQDARYDLRFPVRRYSNQATCSQDNNKIKRVALPRSSDRELSNQQNTPLTARKRGRPRKNPVQETPT